MSASTSRSAPGTRRRRQAAPEKSGEPQESGQELSGWQVYILCCADGSLYTGCTNNLDRRLACHRRKQVKYTRGRLPVELFYCEATDGKGAALRREAAIKKLRPAQKLALAGRRHL